MELNKICALIIVAIFSALAEVQGKLDSNRSQFSKTNNFYRSSLDFSKNKGIARSHKRGTIEKTIIGQTIFENDIKTQRILKYLDEDVPAPLVPDTLEEQSSKEVLKAALNQTTSLKDLAITNTIANNIPAPLVPPDTLEEQSSKELLEAAVNLTMEITNATANVMASQVILYTNDSSATSELAPKVIMNPLEQILIENPENKKQLITSHNFQGAYCRRVMNSKLNVEGKIIDSVQLICDPPPVVTTPRTLPTIKRKATLATRPPVITPPQAMKEKRLERLVVATTPAGINCRRVMNSQLNELEEIIDSVAVVCDPPTTTTTTTKKPTTTSTPTTTTTTPKPLVKVCRRVMNSYLSAEGEIVDAVSIVCKMEAVP